MLMFPVTGVSSQFIESGSPGASLAVAPDTDGPPDTESAAKMEDPAAIVFPLVAESWT